MTESGMVERDGRLWVETEQISCAFDWHDPERLGPGVRELLQTIDKLWERWTAERVRTQ